MTCLVDGDIVAYRCAASAENDSPEIALIRVEGMITEILNGNPNYIIFLSGQNNFRYTINPEYKANRKDKPKPQYLQICRDYLINEYKAIVVVGIEADDALGIHQTDESIIYSIDKDLLMIPGCHYNFVRKEYTEVSELDGLKQFYRQMLIGDKADNIIGIEGIGTVKAGRAIDPLESESEMFDYVYSLYNNPERFWMNADCLWIQRIEGETFSKRYAKTNKETS